MAISVVRSESKSPFSCCNGHVECAGCKNEGKHADPGCPVRPCALDKGVENCAHCRQFICDTLKERINFTEEFLQGNKKLLSDEDFQKYIRPYHGKEKMQKLNRQLHPVDEQ